MQKELHKEYDTNVVDQKKGLLTPRTETRAHFVIHTYDPLLATSEPSAGQICRSKGKKMDRYGPISTLWMNDCGRKYQV